MHRSTTPGWALWVAVCATLLMAQTVQAQEHSIIIDPSVFADLLPKETRDFIEYLAYLVPPQQWPTARFHNESLAEFVIDNYGSNEYPAVTWSIAQIVGNVNGLHSRELKDLRGTDLKIPLLPRIPETTKPGWLQVADTTEVDLYAVKEGGEKTEAARRRGERPEALGAGATWLFETDAARLREPFEIWQTARKQPLPSLIESAQFFVGPAPDVVLPAAFPETAGQPVERSSKIEMDLGRLTADSKYYIVDFFGGKKKCSHGEAVLDVVRDELRRLNALHLENDIVRVNLSYQEDKAASRSEMQKYVAREYAEPIVIEMLGEIESLLRKKKRDEYEVPIFYLQAVLSNIIAQDPQAVVSMSFYIQGDIFQLLPKNYRPGNEGILLGAVLNSPGTIVEQADGLEPIRTFYTHRQEHNVLLVGAWDSEGKPFGMVSAKGDGIAAVAPAFGYGTSEDCVWGKLGTSFATPALGVKLFVARQLWRQNNLQVRGEALRRRLALASTLSADLVGGFASGGGIDLERLMLDAGPFGVTPEGRVQPLTGITGHVEYNRGESSVRRPLMKGPDGFCGIQFVDDRIFLYSDGWSKWSEVSLITAEFQVDDGHGPEILSLSELASRFSVIGVM